MIDMAAKVDVIVKMSNANLLNAACVKQYGEKEEEQQGPVPNSMSNNYKEMIC